MNVSNNVVINTLDLPIINNFNHLAERLSLTRMTLYNLTFNNRYFYTKKEILKSDGTNRVLYVPNLSLKVVQRWILKEILEKIKVSSHAMAFVPNYNGLKLNAECHRRNVFLLQMDIKDFFDSVKEKQVFKLFCNLGYSSDVSAVLANLCTYKNVLPQGAVTSPYISNLISYHLDMRLNGLCCKRDIIYTRYADDLIFSSNNKSKLIGIEKAIKYIVNSEGFFINENKTRYSSNYVKKTTLGITINNEKIHVDKNFKKKIRSMIFNSIINKNYTKNAQILGSIAYVNSIEEGYRQKIMAYISRIISKERFKNNIDIVKEYNNNKFFACLPDMECIKRDQ